jgi:hypothetical protein
VKSKASSRESVQARATGPGTQLSGSFQTTAIVTVFDVAPPMAITTGTAAPFNDPAGTRAFTWYSPTDPGASPENSTEAKAPPIVTVGVVVVAERGLLRASAPL